MFRPGLPRTPEPGTQPRQGFVPGLLVVRVEDDVVSGLPDVTTASASAISRLRLPDLVERPFDALRKANALREVWPVFSRATRGAAFRKAPRSLAASFAMSVRDPESEDLRGINLLQLSADADLGKTVRELAKSRGVVYAHRVPARWACGRRARPMLAVPDDPLVNRQWGLRAIRWFGLRALPNAGQVPVAVLDTGVDQSHPDLRKGQYHHDGVSAGDVIGHGTHVTGIISAIAGNDAGITGICAARPSMWKVFGDTPESDGQYYVDELMYQRALNGARTAGARVVNLSIGGTEHTQTEELLIGRLISSGCVVVAAMGNEYQEGNPIEYPAAYDGVIAVGATTESNRRASFSSTGSHISLCAPGTNILSTLPMKPSAERGSDETEYAAWSGTSMAAPHVSAAAALLIAKDPDLTPAAVARQLTQSAAKLPAMGSRKRTNALGSGLLDLVSALG